MLGRACEFAFAYCEGTRKRSFPAYEVLVTRLVIGQAQQRTFDSCSLCCLCFVALNGFEEAVAYLKTPFCCAGSYPGSLQGWFTSFELRRSYEVGPTSSRARNEPRYHARSFAV